MYRQYVRFSWGSLVVGRQSLASRKSLVVSRWSLVVGGQKPFSPVISSGQQPASNREQLTTNDHRLHHPTQCAGAAAGTAGFAPKSTFGVAREASEAWKYAGFCL